MFRTMAGFMAQYGKRLVIGLVLAALVIAFAQTLPYDLAIWLGGETLLYVDVVLGVAAAATLVRAGPVVAQVRAGAASLMRRARRRARRIATALRAKRPTDDQHRAGRWAAATA